MIKPIVRRDKISKINTLPVLLRFTQNRKSKYVNLGFCINIRSWDVESQCLIDNYKECKKHKLIIDNKLAEYEKKISKLEALDIEITFETLLESKNCNRPNQTIAQYFNIHIAQLKKSGKINTASKYEYTLASLEKFRSMKIFFDRIDFSFLREYEFFLHNSGIRMTKCICYCLAYLSTRLLVYLFPHLFF